MECDPCARWHAPEIIATMNMMTNTALSNPALTQRFNELGIAVAKNSTPEATDAFVAAEMAKAAAASAQRWHCAELRCFHAKTGRIAMTRPAGRFRSSVVSSRSGRQQAPSATRAALCEIRLLEDAAESPRGEIEHLRGRPCFGARFVNLPLDESRGGFDRRDRELLFALRKMKIDRAARRSSSTTSLTGRTPWAAFRERNLLARLGASKSP